MLTEAFHSSQIEVNPEHCKIRTYPLTCYYLDQNGVRISSELRIASQRIKHLH